MIRLGLNYFLVATTIVLAANTARADVIFSDNFTSSTLDPAWQVMSGQGGYTVGGGDLRYFYDGPTASTTGWNNAALTVGVTFSGTNWEIDTKSSSTLQWCPPPQTYTGPAVQTTSCTSGAQGQQVAVKFDPTVSGTNYAGPDAVVIERNIDAYYGSNELTASYHSVTSSNLLNPADSNINNNIAGGTYWYQFIRNGGNLTVNVSYDGISYINAFSTTLNNPTGTFNELLLGGITYSSAGSYSDYSYVNITSPSVPEPGSAGFGFLASGLLAITLKRLRRAKKAGIARV